MRDLTTEASAYGSVMLMGEHSVLHGAKAVVSATEQTLTASIAARDDHIISIDSALGKYSAPITDLSANHTFRFVLASLRYCITNLHLTQGFHLDYRSTIPTTVGLGSSAASVVATVKACYQFVKQPIDNHQLWQICKTIIIAVQGRGSGADLCAAIYGGVCVFNTEQGLLARINSTLLSKLHWQLHYCGYKESTDKVLAKTAELEQQHPQKVTTIYQTMAKLTEDFIHYLEQENSTAVGQTMFAYQQQMVALQVSDKTLDGMVQQLQREPNIIGAKISGSGLGDCVLSVATVETQRLTEHKSYALSFI